MHVCMLTTLRQQERNALTVELRRSNLVSLNPLLPLAPCLDKRANIQLAQGDVRFC